jgi:C4-dicarboxylate transporter DctQ subunit
MLTKLADYCDRIGHLMGAVSVCIISLLALPMVYDVVMRTAGHPTIWAYEMTTYALITATFLANALAFNEGRHFRVTVLLRRSHRTAILLERFSNVVVLGFALLLFVSGWEFAAAAYRIDQHSATLLSMPLYIPRSVVPLGASGLTLQALSKLIRDPDPFEEPSAGDSGRLRA